MNAGCMLPYIPGPEWHQTERQQESHWDSVGTHCRRRFEWYSLVFRSSPPWWTGWTHRWACLHSVGQEEKKEKVCEHMHVYASCSCTHFSLDKKFVKPSYICTFVLQKKKKFFLPMHHILYAIFNTRHKKIFSWQTFVYIANSISS